jgi:ubiquinone/menaquinone biosynthesis C-methylase UbiE
MNLESNRRFWDEKAQENAYWYVSSYGPYEERNLADFWNSGSLIWRDLKSALDYEPRPNDIIVEIGCGVGRLTRAMAPEVGEVHALDLSAEMLGRAQVLGLGNVSFHQSDGQSLAGLPDNHAHLVLAYCVFQHLPSEQVLGDYLREMVRVARPGGLVAFTLTPRTWHARIEILVRARRWLKERLHASGPRGLYQRAWLGIRPSRAAVRRLSPVPIQDVLLHGDKWLFQCRKGERGIAP